MRTRNLIPALAMILTIGVVIATPAVGDAVSLDAFAEPSWSAPPAEDVSARLEDWLTAQPIDEAVRWRALRRWEDSVVDYRDETARLDALAQALAAGDPNVDELVSHCCSSACPRLPCKFAWLQDSRFPPLVRDNMRLYTARWLVQAGLYDEALACLDGVSVEDVVAPATLLFYQAVAHHQLVHADEAESLALQLLERSDELPRRYRQLAELMRQDLEGLEEDSLDHVARRMADVRRRLGKGHAGSRVQLVEQGIIESLDKLIEDLEKQQQQMQQQRIPSGRPSGRPMEDSLPAELKAPGKVDPRDLGGPADWGNLPPKEREEALQEISREFPSHYRDVIEQYFRELANESVEK